MTLSQAKIPTLIILEIAAIIACAECAVMFLLPVIAPHTSEAVQAQLDALILTLLTAPLIMARIASWGRALAHSEAHPDETAGIRPIWLAGAIGLVMTAIAIVSANWVEDRSDSEVRERFARMTERIHLAAQKKFGADALYLRGARAAFDAFGPLDRTAFNRWAVSRGLDEGATDILGISYIERVARRDLDAWIAAVRADGAPDFGVAPPGDGDSLYIVKYAFPRTESALAPGMDLGQDPRFSEAAERSMRTGEIAVTRRFEIERDGQRCSTVFLLLPIWGQEPHPTTAEERERALVGWSCVPVDFKRWIEDVVGCSKSLIDIRVTDDAADDEVLYAATSPDGMSPDHAGPHTETRMEIGGRRWTIAAQATQAFNTAAASKLSAAVFAVGILGAALVATMAWTLMTSRSRAMALARAMTSDLREARETADRANRAKSEFLANMSHEIRTPLTAILGFTDVLAEAVKTGAPNPAQNDMITTIRRAGDHLLMIVNDILDISKIEAGRIEVQDIEMDLPALLQSVGSMVAPRAAEKGLAFGIEVLTPIPTRMLGDPTRLRQIILNIAGNAVKFTAAGSVSVRVSVIGEAADRTLVIDVADTGTGIGDAEIARIFEPFSQADTSFTRRYGGTGLGLSISRRLAQKLGGDVALIATAPGRGSTFRLAIPLRVPAASEMTRSISERRATRTDTAASNPSQIAGRILLAEDGRENQLLVGHCLRRAGAKVDIAENGRIALEMYRRAIADAEPYDLLLTDIQMPEMDGHTLTRTLRAEGHDIPIVALTAHAMVEDRDACFASGCDDYTQKPIDRLQLVETCDRWISKRRAERPVST